MPAESKSHCDKKNPLKVWSIGEESELFAVRSEKEVREFYVELVGLEMMQQKRLKVTSQNEI